MTKPTWEDRIHPGDMLVVCLWGGAVHFPSEPGDPPRLKPIKARECIVVLEVHKQYRGNMDTWVKVMSSAGIGMMHLQNLEPFYE